MPLGEAEVGPRTRMRISKPVSTTDKLCRTEGTASGSFAHVQNPQGHPMDGSY